MPAGAAERLRSAIDLDDPALIRVLETVPAGVMIVDTTGTIAFVNSIGKSVLRPGGGRVIGRRHTDKSWQVLNPDGSPMSDEERPFSRVMSSGAGLNDFEMVIQRHDGSRVVGLVNVALLLAPDGSAVGVLAAISDITDRKAAEATLRESERRLRLALDAAKMGTFEWEVPDGRIVWSQGHEELWGYEPGEFDGTYESFSDRIHPDDLAALEHAIQRSMAERCEYECEYRVVWSDGSIHWVLCRGEFSFDADGRPERMRGVVLETTARRLAEEGRARSEALLRLALERAESVREEEQRRLARQLHDELGQSLTGMKMDLSWIDRRLVRNTDLPAVNEIRSKVASLKAEVDSTVGFVRRISAELRPAVLDELGLPAVLEWQTQEFARRADLECSVVFRGDDLEIEPRAATAIYRILKECLTNIARHAEATRVEVTLTRARQWVRLDVRDDGRGISRGGPIDSSSLGLVGMRERARALGGSFRLTGAPGEGVTVTVRIPRP